MRQNPEIYRDGLIAQALSTYQAGLAAYQTGKLDFETLVSAFLDVLHFDEGYWKALSDHEQALARIEELTGVSSQYGSLCFARGLPQS